MPEFGLKLTAPLIWAKHAPAYYLATALATIKLDTSLEASVSGVEIEYRDGKLIISWDHHTLAALPLYEALFGFRKTLMDADSRLTNRETVELQKGGATVTVPVAHGTASFSSDGDVSLSITHGDVTTTFSLGREGLTISMSMTANVPKPVPQVGTTPVEVAVTTTVQAFPRVKESQPNTNAPTVEPAPKTDVNWLDWLERILIPSPGPGAGAGQGSGAAVRGYTPVPEGGFF